MCLDNHKISRYAPIIGHPWGYNPGTPRDFQNSCLSVSFPLIPQGYSLYKQPLPQGSFLTFPENVNSPVCLHESAPILFSLANVSISFLIFAYFFNVLLTHAGTFLFNIHLLDTTFDTLLFFHLVKIAFCWAIFLFK